MKISPLVLTGRSNEHIVKIDDGVVIHQTAKEAYRKLKKRAAAEGFDLRVASGFRDFASQSRIWNLKAEGKRTLLDEKGEPMEYAALAPAEIVTAILRWSALPGASRHHWGTEIDVFDRNSVSEVTNVQLIPQEAAAGGIFYEFNLWLGDAMKEEGFFRPYREDRGGVSPEWWHLSYRPVSEPYFEAQTLALIQDAIEGAELVLKAEVLALLPEIYRRYVRNISPA